MQRFAKHHDVIVSEERKMDIVSAKQADAFLSKKMRGVYGMPSIRRFWLRPQGIHDGYARTVHHGIINQRIR